MGIGGERLPSSARLLRHADETSGQGEADERPGGLRGGDGGGDRAADRVAEEYNARRLTAVVSPDGPDGFGERVGVGEDDRVVRLEGSGTAVVGAVERDHRYASARRAVEQRVAGDVEVHR